jgi:hypothetical protein
MRIPLELLASSVNKFNNLTKESPDIKEPLLHNLLCSMRIICQQANNWLTYHTKVVWREEGKA